MRYAIFGLGDTAYPHFCGFTQALDARLTQYGARAIVNRVDADVNFEPFFTTWLTTLGKVLAGDAQAGRDLHLRVTAYGEDHAFSAALLERRPLSARTPQAWHLRLNIAGSGIVYRAGDTVYLLPENDEGLLSRLADWLGRPEAVDALRRRELRQLSKTTLRELARLADGEELKGLLKIRQRKALESYLYGADLLDVLHDFCPPHAITLENLLALLPVCLPRAYSIASATRKRASICAFATCVMNAAAARGAARQPAGCSSIPVLSAFSAAPTPAFTCRATPPCRCCLSEPVPASHR